MSHLNFNIRAAEVQPQPRAFDPRSKVSLTAWSVLWTVFAVAAVAGATFAIVWFA
jgi:hypothetical protein